MGDLNCDLLSETIIKSSSHIYTYGQVIKEATRTTAETNILTYYIVTNKKGNIADIGIILCGISDHDLVYIIRHATLPKIKKDPKINMNDVCRLTVANMNKLVQDKIKTVLSEHSTT